MTSAVWVFVGALISGLVVGGVYLTVVGLSEIAEDLHREMRK